MKSKHKKGRVHDTFLLPSCQRVCSLVPTKWKRHKVVIFLKWKWAQSYKGCIIQTWYWGLAAFQKALLFLPNPRESGVDSFFLLAFTKLQKLTSCSRSILSPWPASSRAEHAQTGCWRTVLEKAIQKPNCREPGDRGKGICLHHHPKFMPCEGSGQYSGEWWQTLHVSAEWHECLWEPCSLGSFGGTGHQTPLCLPGGYQRHLCVSVG